MTRYDYIVVGSGCSGAMAAQTLIEAGMSVTMIDAGIPADEAVKVPDESFLELRSTDAGQHRYFIGDAAKGVSWGKVGKGEQITPPRQHILQEVDKFIPVDSDSFSPLESLGYGGLGIGWGLQCWEYTPGDLAKTGLVASKMYPAYQTVADRIGISASRDDAARYTIGKLNNFQPSATMDNNNRYIFDKYLKKKGAFNQKGMYLGRTPLALLTENKDGRKKYAYRDMDFYSDNDQSAWRPWITVNALRKQPKFHYFGGYVVVRFQETSEGVSIHCLTIKDNTATVFHCRRLILATSALGSARVVLRSLGQANDRLPLLCNPYSYIPCVQLPLVGKAAEPNKLGFTQLSLFYDQHHDQTGASVASIYSYQSLMLFRIIRHAPLNFVDGRILMRYLLSGLVIMGIHHPDEASAAKYVSLVADALTPTKDKLHVNFELPRQQQQRLKKLEKTFIGAMRQLGTHAIKRVDPGYGASIHYGGTLPFSKKAEPFRLDPSGRLHGTKQVFVADSSGFQYLPAPGLTLSLMANAHLVAKGALHG